MPGSTNTTSVTERGTVDADGVTASRGCKDEEDDDKRYEGLGHVVKREWSKWRWRSPTWQNRAGEN